MAQIEFGRFKSKIQFNSRALAIALARPDLSLSPLRPIALASCVCVACKLRSLSRSHSRWQSSLEFRLSLSALDQHTANLARKLSELTLSERP